MVRGGEILTGELDKFLIAEAKGLDARPVIGNAL